MSAKLRNLGLAACSLLAALATGCQEGEGDTTTVINNLGGGRGTNARDTLDLNIGTDAAFNTDNGFGAFSGPDGSILLAFKQNHGDNTGPSPETNLSNGFNYARVLADTAGPIMPLDDHADPRYEDQIDGMRQSWNLRYVAFLNQYSFFPTLLKLVVWDFTTGRFTEPVLLASSANFQTQNGFPTVSFAGMQVDNNGRVTVLFNAIDANSADGNDVMLWSVQYETSTETISHPPSPISGAFRVPGNSQNFVNYVASRGAANGDIAVLFSRNDNYGAAAAPNFHSTLFSAVYKQFTDSWGAATRADNQLDDRFGAPVSAPNWVELDTDANSFQYSFIQNSDPFGNLPGVWSSRFVASTGTTFPTPVRLDTATAVTNRRVQTGIFPPIDIHFGRNGASLVHWYETETGQFPAVTTIWASSSSNTAAPASANSAELLNASNAANPGYTVKNFVAGSPTPPEFAFDDAGNALVSFVATNADATPDDELYVATFNGTTFTPANPGADNLANSPVPAAGQTRSVQQPVFGGFSAGVNPRCVLAWAAELRNASNTFLQGVSSGVVFDGLTAVSVPVQLDSTGISRFGVSVASGNRFNVLGENLFGNVVSNQRTDEYPAFGNGNVWVMVAHNSNTTGSLSNGYTDLRAMSFNPVVHSNLVVNGATLNPLGQLGGTENWMVQADGSMDIAQSVMGIYYQRSCFPAASAVANPTAGALQLLTPPDMKQVSSGGVHLDGMNWIRTFSGAGVTSTLVDVPRRWTLWEAEDTLSQRLFGVRSR